MLSHLISRSLLLPSLLGLNQACLPPEYAVEPRINHPVSIDKSLLSVDPDKYVDVSDCQSVIFDVAPALQDPDKDPLYTVWLLNYEPGLGSPPDAVGLTRYTFRPCENPKFQAGELLTLELLVLDRQPLSFDDADESRIPVDSETTMDNVVWFIGANDLSCCPGIRP